MKNGQAGILRGPNGVGKTTLLRALAGLQPVEAGTIKCSIEVKQHSAALGVGWVSAWEKVSLVQKSLTSCPRWVKIV